MTICQSMKKWLSEYGNIDLTDILTDFIEAPEGSAALFNSPNRDIVQFNDGSKRITDHFQFFIRKSTVLQEERDDNIDLLGDFTNWIEERDFSEDYPDLGDGLICEGISVNGSATIIEQNDDNAIYQVTVGICYLKEV